MQTRKKRKIPQTSNNTKPIKSRKIHPTPKNSRQPHLNRTSRSRSPKTSRPRRPIPRTGRHKNGYLTRNNLETPSKRKKKGCPSPHRRKTPHSHSVNKTWNTISFVCVFHLFKPKLARSFLRLKKGKNVYSSQHSRN